jgi:hypothetical protein
MSAIIPDGWMMDWRTIMPKERKLTPEMRADCVEMRRQGHTLRQIAKKHGVTYAAIEYNLIRDMPEYLESKAFGHANMKRLREKCVYPGITKWMIGHRISPVALARGCGLKSSYVYMLLSGKAVFNKKNIDTLLSFTGMTYEEAFGRGDA